MIENIATIKLAAEHGKLKLIKNFDATTQSVNTIQIVFSFLTDEWKDMNKIVVFFRKDIEPLSVIIGTDNSCLIPWEILDVPSTWHGDILYDVGIIGTDASNARLTTNKLRLKIQPSCFAESQQTQAPTPTIYEQILAKIDSLNDYSEDEIKQFIADYCTDNNFATKEYVDINGGKIDSIKVNGIKQEIIDKTVDIVISDENLSQAVEDYIDAHPITETDPTVPNWAKQPNKPTYTANEVGALPNDTVIPNKISELINDSGFITEVPESILNDINDMLNKKTEQFFTHIFLPKENWVDSMSLYSQIVTIDNITTTSRIDFQPTPTQIAQLQDDETVLTAQNDDGIITVYAIGTKPTVDYDIQVTITDIGGIS